MAQESIFPEVRIVPPLKVLCECVGSAVVRVAQLGKVTDPIVSNHIRRPDPDPRPAANELVN